MNIPQELQSIINCINQYGECVIVGGYVRDSIMGIDSKDIDIEVFNVSFEELSDILSAFGKVDIVGQSFGVVKLRTKTQEYDFSLPRIDSRNGVGHKGFSVEFYSELTPEQAASRRDFTINSIGWNGGFIDPFNGMDHIETKILAHTSDAFSEDPLRVLRGFQFCARFELTAAVDTMDLCRDIATEFHDIPKERVWTEWEKWATKSVKPSLGLQFLKQTEWIQHFPQIANLIDCPQDPEWHPEGDVFVHTSLVCDAAAEIADRENLSKEDRTVLLFAALCHDFGKPETTVFSNDRWRAPKHDKAGVPHAKEFLSSINAPNWVIDGVLPLVSEHMAHCGVSASRKIAQRLSVRLKQSSIRMLAFLIEADMNGRSPRKGGLPEVMCQIVDIARQHNCYLGKPKRIIEGRDISHLVEAGPLMGKVVNKLYEMQVDDKFSTRERGMGIAKQIARDPTFVRQQHHTTQRK